MTQSSGCPWTTRTSTHQTLIIKMWIKAENTQRPPPSGRMFLKTGASTNLWKKQPPSKWKYENGAFLQKKNGLEATIMSSQVDSVPYVHKKKWISVNLSKNEKLYHLTILRPCHNVWWQFISAENQINSNTRSLFFGGNKTLILKQNTQISWLLLKACHWNPVTVHAFQSNLTFSNIFLWLLTERLWRNKKWN